MRVSIKDIARAAGVSHPTVSRALSDSPLISQATKERIQRLAREMGYSPNALARGLVTRQTYSIGVVVTTIADPFVAEIVQGIETTAQDHGYTVILCNSGAEPEREIAAVELLRSKRVDGVIVTSSRIGALYLNHLERIGAPIVLINNHNEQSGRYTFSVSVDNRHGGWLATRHLVQLGHQRIGYVTGPPDSSSDLDRRAGYGHALMEAGVEADAALVIAGTGRPEAGAAALEKLLALDDPPTAVVCYNDMTAIGLVAAARQRGLRVPRHLSVVGFDDIVFASYLEPPLTTVAQPKVDMGRRAMDMMLALITAGSSDDLDIADTVVQGQLVVRGSTRRLPGPGNRPAKRVGHS
jgi:DNA-binding LacI/PurR family transcriptional regulator